MFQFIKTTALGGVVFLTPVIILVAILTQAHQLLGKIAAPVLAVVPIERVFGIVVLNLTILALGALICFLAGLAAKSPLADELVSTAESKFLSKVPAYDVEKAKLAARMQFEDAGNARPVLVRFDDQSQIGFEMERIAGGNVVVYFPGAPDPWSGAISIATEDRVTRLDSNLSATLGIFKHLGRGAGDQLQKCLEGS